MRIRLSLAIFVLGACVAVGQETELSRISSHLADEMSGGRLPSRELLARRQGLLRELIRRDPAAAQKVILPGRVQLAIDSLPADLQALVEAPVAYETSRSFVVDSADWRSSFYGYEVETPTGRVFAYQSPAAGDEPGCGTRMRVTGYRLGDTMLVTGATTVSRDASPACSTLGDQKVAVILVEYADAKIVRPNSMYESVFFGEQQSVNDFYREMSYGKASVSGAVIGPITIPHKYDVCATGDIWNQVLDAADLQADLTAFNRVVVIVPPVSCGFGGMGQLSCYDHKLTKAGTVRLSMVFEFDAEPAEIMRVAPHELGHNLGLSHARTLSFGTVPLGPDPNKATRTEYGDVYSSMGGGGPVHFSAQNKRQLGWMVADETRTVEADGLFDLVSTSDQTTGIRALRIRRNVLTDQFLWVEFRNGTGYDSGIAPQLESGAIVHFEDPTTSTATYLLSFGPTINDSDLYLNSTWSDPYSNLTLTVVEWAPDHVRIAVRYDNPCAKVAWPSKSQYAADAFTLTGTITVSGPDCTWTASANDSWLSNTDAGNFAGAENTWSMSRRGSVTVARQTFFVNQQPALQPLKALYFGPAQIPARINAAVTFTAGVSLPNATSTTGSIDILWNATPTFPLGCAMNYDFATQKARLLDASGNPTGSSLAAGSTSPTLSNSTCTISQVTDSRTTPYETRLSINWRPNGLLGQTWTAYYRLHTSPTSVPENWNVGSVLLVPSATGSCMPSTPTTSLTAPGSGTKTTLSTSLTTACPWTATSDADWLTVTPASGNTAAATLSLNVAANPAATARSTIIRFNELRIPVVQYPANTSGPVYAAFSTPDFRIKRNSGSMAMSYSTNLSAGQFNWSVSGSWLRVSSSCLTDAGCPSVSVAWDANPDSTSRTATLQLVTIDGRSIPGGQVSLIQDGNIPQATDAQLSLAAGRGDHDGDSALSAIVRVPSDLALDADGALWFGEINVPRIRRVLPDGTVQTMIGNWLTSGNTSGPASSVRLNSPRGLWFTPSGDLYFADSGTNMVRKLGTDGNVTLIAGNGTNSSTGDGGKATLASLRGPYGVAVATDGTVYVSDTSSHRIRKISPDGIIAPFAGTGVGGYGGDTGPAAQARLNSPAGLAFAPDGSLLIADQSNNRVRRVAPDGTISTIAGTGVCGSTGDNGQATAATICSPTKLSVKDGQIYIGGSARVRRIAADGKISTLPSALIGLFGMAVLPGGQTYVADNYANQVFLLRDGGSAPVAGLANADRSDVGHEAVNARLNNIGGATQDAAGNVLFSDSQRHQVLRITPDGTLEAVAGSGSVYDSANKAMALNAPVPSPKGILVHPDGSIYIAVSCNVKRLDPATGMLSLFAGSTSCGYRDATSPTDARFYGISQMALGPDGSIYLADSYNYRIRKVDPTGAVTTLAGNGTYGPATDGVDATTSPLRYPQGIAVDAQGTVYFSDSYNYRIRRIGTDGILSTFAGSSWGFSGDGRLAKAARIGLPTHLSLATDGTLWFTDNGNHVVWQVDLDGRAHVVAGTGQTGFAQPDTPAWANPLYNPQAIFAGPNGVYFGETSTGRLWLLKR